MNWIKVLQELHDMHQLHECCEFLFAILLGSNTEQGPIALVLGPIAKGFNFGCLL